MPPDSMRIPASAIVSPQGERRREELLDVAIDVFGQSGFAGARIDDVARRVGIRRPSVLYHFPDKSTLYFAAIARVVDEVADRIVAGPVDTPERRIEAMVDRWVDFVVDRPLAARLLLRQMIDGDASPIEADGTGVAVRRLLATIQAVLDTRAEAETMPAKPPLDAASFALILASTTLVWVAGRGSVERTIGLDTLSEDAIATHRAMLRALARQLLQASLNGSDATRVEFGRDPVPKPVPWETRP